MKPFHWWRTVFFLIPAVGLYTIVLGIVSLTSTLVDRSGHFAHKCARTWARLILWTTGVKVERSGPLPPLESSTVIVSNHASIYDIPILFTALPLQLRIPAKASLGSFPFIGWHLRLAGHLLIERTNPGPGIIKRMKKMVQQNASLIIFPEGSRSSDGLVGQFKGGSFLLAIDNQLPIVPVTIVNSPNVMRKGELMVQPATVQVILHEPIATTGMTRADARALAKRVQDVVAQDAKRA
ncbi:MAG TPA: lysophospholipid acyltransferase family protein [Vicinamibacterales bacterium]|nr:lysophospholipid acyltransferase family protein [Vicinamibacterales bacterium]